jgi:hypothetical protein
MRVGQIWNCRYGQPVQKLADNGMISPRSVPTKQWGVIDGLRSLAPSSEASSSTKGIQKLDARSGLGFQTITTRRFKL